MQDQELVVRKRQYHGISLYWIGRGNGKDFRPYHDIFAPTGYGFKSKAHAERIATEIEQRLNEKK